MSLYPLVSIIIPVYNREALIQRSIKSILNQTYKNLEIVVVDDGSTDNTEIMVKYLNDSRIKYEKLSQNMGQSYARNFGIKKSSGEYIAFHDSDDECYPEKIEKQLSALVAANKEVGAIYCGREFYDSYSGEKIGEDSYYTDLKNNFRYGAYLYAPCTVVLLIKREVLEDIGGFDENMRNHEDTELVMRICKKYEIIFLPDILVKVYRYHDQLMGNVKEPILAKEIIYSKHKNFLSNKILSGMCKIIANYYILTKNFSKARSYLRFSLKHSFQFKSLALFVLLLLFPSLVYYLYERKYKGTIPITSGIKPRTAY